MNWDFTSNEAAAQAYIFFIAGFETSSLIIQYALYEMSINPIIQDKARIEIMSVLKEHNGKITYDALNEMKYLDKVVQGKRKKQLLLMNYFVFLEKTGEETWSDNYDGQLGVSTGVIDTVTEVIFFFLKTFPIII